MSRETKEEREIVREAQKRFKACQDWEGSARALWNDDQKFAEGDSDNLHQWNSAQVTSRTNDPNGARPCLTINKTRQHCLQILNDARQNKAQIEIRPTGDGATYDSAKIFEGITRYIEYRSNATEAYEAASRHQVYGGWGYWRVLTEYSDPTSFDQDIKIQRVADPLSVYLDLDIEEFDGSDARFGFVFRDVPKDRFEAEYPRFKGVAGSKALCDEGRTWDDDDHVRVAEYYRRKEVPDTLYALSDGSTMLRSEMPADIREEFDDRYAANEPISAESSIYVMADRETVRHEVEWFKIAGNRIIDRRPWMGKYIPLVRVIGEETVIDGKLDRKGHVRALKDPQRMYNYWSSAAVEHVALQGKSPYIAAAAAIEGHEAYWRNANRENYSVLPFNHTDDAGQEIPKPERQMPPQASTAYATGMQVAAQEMMMVSGQYQAEMGAPSNERSGVAIQQRQRQGDNATYHYIDHLAQAIRFTGRILIDLIPKVYDTERVLKIMAENGSQSDVHIDPNADKPVAKMVNDKPASDEELKAAQADPNLRDQVKTIFNPNVGRYSVEADIGPAYATRRQEAFQALSQLMQQNQELARIAGDLLFKAADFPMADEIAERIKRTIPANVLGEADPPAMMQLQQQNQQLQALIQQLQTALASKEAKEQGEAIRAEDRHALDSYRAETDRMKALAGTDPAAFKPLVRQLVQDAYGIDLDAAMNAHAVGDAMRGAVPGMMSQPAPTPPGLT